MSRGFIFLICVCFSFSLGASGFGFVYKLTPTNNNILSTLCSDEAMSIRVGGSAIPCSERIIIWKWLSGVDTIPCAVAESFYKDMEESFNLDWDSLHKRVDTEPHPSPNPLNPHLMEQRGADTEPFPFPNPYPMPPEKVKALMNPHLMEQRGADTEPYPFPNPYPMPPEKIKALMNLHLMEQRGADTEPYPFPNPYPMPPEKVKAPTYLDLMEQRGADTEPYPFPNPYPMPPEKVFSYTFGSRLSDKSPVKLLGEDFIINCDEQKNKRNSWRVLPLETHPTNQKWIWHWEYPSGYRF